MLLVIYLSQVLTANIVGSLNGNADTATSSETARKIQDGSNSLTLSGNNAVVFNTSGTTNRECKINCVNSFK